MVQRDFYIMWIRYNTPCKGENCDLLPKVKAGEEVYFEKEPDNSHDSNAIRIVTQSGDMLGYVPRYYTLPIIERMDKGVSYICKITDINSNKDCSECIKVRLNMPRD